MQIPSVQGFIADVVNKYAVVSSNNNVGINGFVFDIDAQDEVTVENEATDHYIEANSAIQDHVAHRPKTITLKGFIGELKDEALGATMSILSNIQSLGDIGGLAPNFSEQAAQVYSKIEGVVSKVDSYINQANNLFDIFSDKSSATTAQARAHAALAAFADNNVLCTVSTPFGIFKNMLVTRLGSIQREDTEISSDFVVMFKEIRTVETITGVLTTMSGRAADAISNVVSKGQVTGKTVDVTVFDGIGRLIP